jgi:hypothetical protein
MNLRPSFIVPALLSLQSIATAAPDFDRLVENATEKRDRGIAQASEPFNREFLDTMQDLLKKATAAGDLEAALKIKTIVDWVDVKGQAGRIPGTWLDESKTSRLEFTGSGTFKEFWGGKVQQGRYKNKSATKVEVELSNGNIYEYVIVSEDGNTIMRANDGMKWLRIAR